MAQGMAQGMAQDGDQATLVEVVNAALPLTVPAAHAMGVVVVEAAPGRAAATVPLEGNGNHFGVMYAGVLFTVAEVLGGVLALASFDAGSYYPLVKELRITFARPARSQVRACAELSAAEVARVAAQARERGKADFDLEATVTDADGQVVATTCGRYQVRAHGR